MSEKGSGTGWIVAVVIVVLMLIVGFILAAVSAGSRKPPRRKKKAPVRQAAPRKQGSKRYNELGGKSMKEWCAEEEANNPDLQERKQRVKDIESGRKKRI